jgi:hypothetical protein
MDIKIPKEVNEKLLGYQTQHVDRIIYSLEKHNALDASDTGTGKSYTSIAAAMCLGLKPFIMCPKSVLRTWSDVLKHFKCKNYGFSNYESIQNCRYFKTLKEKIRCPYVKKEITKKEIPKKKEVSVVDKIDRLDSDEKPDTKKINNQIPDTKKLDTKNNNQKLDIKNNNQKNNNQKLDTKNSNQKINNQKLDTKNNNQKVDTKNLEKNPKPKPDLELEKTNSEKKPEPQQKPEKRIKKLYKFTWNFPDDTLIIFDEAHRCKNRQTVNSLMLYSLTQQLKDKKDTKTRILMLSATVADKPENFVIAGYVLSQYNSLKDATKWIENKGIGFQNPMSGVHDAIYPNYASRMRIRELAGLFPDNQVLAQCYDMDTAKEIEEQYALIKDEVDRLKFKEQMSTSALAEITYARMRIEQLKIPTFLEETKKFLDEGASVVIFVNFTNTLEALKTKLKTNCVVYGQQTLEERDHNIKLFNTDKSRVIICNARSGGVGISLHDTIGVHPRVSIISPSWSAQDIIQVLGRCHRARGKTPVRQRIIYCSGTIEDDICKNITLKINNIANLNDGDLLSYNITGLTDAAHNTKIMKPEDEKNHLIAQIDVLELRKQRTVLELEEIESELKSLTAILNGDV